MRLSLLSVAAALAATVLAGCAGGHDHLDTGTIAPGEQKALTFAEAGVYELHCHPHPFMLHTVTVVDGGPAEVLVKIHDGATVEEYRYEPRNVTVGVGGRVVYLNAGREPHTATYDGHAH
jgi:plastocyanin